MAKRAVKKEPKEEENGDVVDPIPIKRYAAFLRPLRHPVVICVLVLSILGGGFVREGLSTLTGGWVKLTTDEQKILFCVIRALDNKEIDSETARITAIRICIPKKIERQAEE